MNPLYAFQNFAPSGYADANVRRFQDILAYWGSRGLPIPQPFARDGILGPDTSAAVSAYQRQSTANGRPLAVTGTLDAATRDSLERSAPQAIAAGFLSGGPGAAAPVVRGTHPKVNTIATATGPVAVPESVSKMIPPAAVAQLQTMPATAAQSFVNDLAQKVTTGAAQGVEILDAGTGKSDVTAVPVLQPNGTVTAALSTTPTTGWAAFSDVEKVAIGVGAVAVAGTLIYLVARKN